MRVRDREHHVSQRATKLKIKHSPLTQGTDNIKEVNRQKELWNYSKEMFEVSLFFEIRSYFSP